MCASRVGEVYDGIIGHFVPISGACISSCPIPCKAQDLCPDAYSPLPMPRYLCPGVHVSALILAFFSTGQRRVALRRKGWRPHAGPCYTVLQTGPITLSGSCGGHPVGATHIDDET